MQSSEFPYIPLPAGQGSSLTPCQPPLRCDEQERRGVPGAAPLQKVNYYQVIPNKLQNPMRRPLRGCNPAKMLFRSGLESHPRMLNLRLCPPLSATGNRGRVLHPTPASWVGCKKPETINKNIKTIYCFLVSGFCPTQLAGVGCSILPRKPSTLPWFLVAESGGRRPKFNI